MNPSAADRLKGVRLDTCRYYGDTFMVVSSGKPRGFAAMGDRIQSYVRPGRQNRSHKSMACLVPCDDLHVSELAAIVGPKERFSRHQAWTVARFLHTVTLLPIRKN